MITLIIGIDFLNATMLSNLEKDKIPYSEMYMKHLIK